MNWGKSITLSFIAFGTLIISMVVISMQQDIDLVAEDYYAQEIEYQERIDQMQNTASLLRKPEVSLNGKMLRIIFPESEEVFAGGRVQLFSPVSDQEDVLFELPVEVFPAFNWDMDGMRRGRWKVKLEWTAGSRRFYQESAIELP